MASLYICAIILCSPPIALMPLLQLIPFLLPAPINPPFCLFMACISLPSLVQGTVLNEFLEFPNTYYYVMNLESGMQR